MASCPACGHRPIKKNKAGVRACPRHGPLDRSPTTDTQGPTS